MVKNNLLERKEPFSTETVLLFFGSLACFIVFFLLYLISDGDSPYSQFWLLLAIVPPLLVLPTFGLYKGYKAWTRYLRGKKTPPPQKYR